MFAILYALCIRRSGSGSYKAKNKLMCVCMCYELDVRNIICEMTSCVYKYEIIHAIICELNSMFIVFVHRQYYA